MEMLENLSLITSVKMGGATRILGNFPSMAASNVLEFINSRVADCHILSILGLTLRPQGGAVLVSLVPMGILVTILSLEARVEDLLIPL